MSEELHRRLNRLPDEDLVRILAFEQSEYGHRMLTILKEIYTARGLAPEDIASVRKTVRGNASVECACERCCELLLLHETDLFAGEFTCSACDQRQIIAYSRLSRDEPIDP